MLNRTIRAGASYEFSADSRHPTEGAEINKDFKDRGAPLAPMPVIPTGLKHDIGDLGFMDLSSRLRQEGTFMKTSILSRASHIALALLTALNLTPAYGQKMNSDVLEFKGPQQTAEYIFKNSPRDVLITVQLFGSVARPGIYYVPEDTDLMKLLTLSGGVMNTTELEEIIVRKGDNRSWHGLNLKFVERTQENTYQVDVDRLLRESPTMKPLRMSHQDFVYVPQKSPFISNDMSRAITIGSIVLSAVLTVLLIDNNVRRNQQ